MPARRIEAADRLEDAIGAGRVIGPGQHGLAAGGLDGFGDLRLARRPPAPGRSPASMARRQTWTIIGSPWISARGLPGRRVEAMRAGMTMSGFT